MVEEALISSTMEIILTNLISTVTEEIKLVSSLPKDIENLKDKSEMILALLHDAEKGRIEKKSVTLWLNKMKDAVYDAGDGLDEFAYEILRRTVEIQNSMKKKAWNFGSISNPIAFRFKMAHKVKNLNMALDRVVKQGADLGLTQALHQDMKSPGILGHQLEFRRTHPFANDSKVLGREVDKSKVLHILLKSQSEENLSVVAIVGLAGLGKTTLAQLIYKDEGVTRYFDERIWVCVSNDFNVKRILKEMTDCIGISIDDMTNETALIKKLNEKLSTKKYLLVLDDVWNREAHKWELLTDSLFGIGGDRESKILVTTRSDEVVSTMRTLNSLHLGGLSEYDSWSLFREKAFAIGGAKETAYMVDVGRRMVKRCKGVPLAIKTLGALMHTKQEHEWSSIEQSELWNFSHDEGGIMHALQFSFNHFPSPYLKQCYVYCSIFPKDFRFQKDDMIQLWIAQGFIQSSPGSQITMEDTGNEYFKILLWNSFFQDVEMDKYDNIKTCMMHDLVHDLAKSISKSEVLVLKANTVSDGVKVRHLSLVKNEGKFQVIANENAAKLRTLFLPRDLRDDFLRNFKCLRVLNFEKTNIEELPKSIGKLKNLRYLNVSYTRIKVFPTSIIKLYNLQTIRLMGCKAFGELPKELRSLISLTHICFDAEYGGRLRKMPIDMGRLTSLQTLSRFVVGHDKGHQIEELGSLNALRDELQVTKLEQVKDKIEAKRANLLMKTRLFKLRLTWSSGREGDKTDDEDVLEGLQPPPNLGSLTIEEFDGRSFPSWMITANVNNRGNSLLPDSLVEIRLNNCRKCELIPTLGELPFLRFLELKGMDNLKRIGVEFYRSNSSNNTGGASSSSNGGGTVTKRSTLFPKLEKFTLEYMNNLEEWTEAATTAATEGCIVFPCLEELTIKSCEALRIAPTHFSFLKYLRLEEIKSGVPIANICSGLTTTLTSLYIDSVSELISLLKELLLNLVSLEYLTIWRYPELSSIPNLYGLTSLRTLDIFWCGISNLPIGLGSCTSLEKLKVFNCPNLIWVAGEDLRELKSLSSLEITRCGKLKGVGFEFLHCLTRLEELSIGGFWEELESFPFNLNINQQHHLKSLNLYGRPKLKSLPDQLQHLTALRDLLIVRFDGMEALQDWLRNLSSLQKLKIWYCKNLKDLPSVESMRRLTNLRLLEIIDCPLLKERCTKHSGPEWSKISHIPQIEIDNETIQDLTTSSSS